MDAPTEQLFANLEARVDTLDEILAHLMQGYLELAAHVESIIVQIITPLEPEAATAFTASMTEHRRQMFDAVKDITHGLAGYPHDPDAPADPAPTAVDEVAG